MRLVELRYDEQSLRLHPRLAFVDSPPAERQRIVEVLSGVLAGARPSGPHLAGLLPAGLIELHGVLLDLDGANLNLLGIDPARGFLLQPDELALSALAVATRATERAEAEVMAIHEREIAADDVVRGAERDRDAAATALAACRSTLAIARRRRGRATREREEAAERQRASTELVAERASLLAELQRLVHADPEPVRAALAELEAAPGGVDAGRAQPAPADAHAGESEHDDPLVLADRLDDVDRRLAELSRQIAGDEAEVVAAQRRVDEARQALLAAERDARPVALTPGDTEALETAHQAAVEASERVDRRLGGGSARRRLEEARAAEQAILDRLGIASYTDYVMRSSGLGDDRGLQDARAELRRAEAVVTDLHRRSRMSNAWSLLMAERNSLRAAAAVVLGEGADPHGDLAPALRALHASASGRDPMAALRGALRRVGVTGFGADAVGAARAWLAAVDAESPRRTEIERRLAELDATLGTAGAGDVMDSDDEETVEDQEQALLTALGALDAAEADMSAAEAAVSAAIAARDAVRVEMGAAEAAFTTAAAELAAVRAAVESGTARGAVEELEQSLSRAVAARRARSFVGGVPVVFDDVLREAGGADLAQLLNRLDRAADFTQCIYLTDDRSVLAWGRSLGPARAGVVVASSRRTSGPSESGVTQ